MAISTATTTINYVTEVANVTSWIDVNHTSNGSITTPEASSTASTTSAPDSGFVSIILQNGLTMVLPYTTIFLLTFVGNLMVILTLGLNKRMRTVTNAFLFNLSLSDLLLGVFCMPFTLVGVMARSWVFGAFLCRIVPYLQAVSVSVSSWTLVTMSYERYYAICHPLKSREVHQTWSHTKRVIGGVWLASFVAMAPIALLSELQPIRRSDNWKCREAWPSDAHERAFTIFLDVYLFAIPLVIMTTTYTCIASKLWSTMARQLPAETSENASEVLNCRPLANNAGSDETNSLTASMATAKRDTGGFMSSEADHCSMSSNGSCDEASPSSLASGHEMSVSVVTRPVVVSFRCNQETQRHQQQRRIIKMLFVVVLEFFICWTPLHVINTLTLYAPRIVYVDLGYNWISIFQLLAFMSACTNPITYCFMNRTFRRSFMDLFKCSRRSTASRSFSSGSVMVTRVTKA